MSDIESEIESIGRTAYNALKDAKDHPALIGVTLLGAGLAIREFGQAIDFVVFDFGGNHVPPQSTKPPPDTPPSDPNNPQNLPPWAKAATDYVAKFLGLAQMTLPGANIAEGILSQTPLDPNKALAQLGSPVPNLFDLLGLKLPTQITLSETLIIAGLVFLFDPLIKAISGAIGGLEKALPFPKIG